MLGLLAAISWVLERGGGVRVSGEMDGISRSGGWVI